MKIRIIVIVSIICGLVYVLYKLTHYNNISEKEYKT